MSSDEIAKSHEGIFSASRLGCMRSAALEILGYKPKISKRMESIFEAGQEHDQVMKEEAEEEFDDFEVPKEKRIILKRGDLRAVIILHPDGLRPNEVVEFKGLSPNNFNSINSFEDMFQGDPLYHKYYLQVQAYAGGFKKENIRLRLKNKRNLKIKDVMGKANPEIWKRIKREILDTQELLNKGELPPVTCSSSYRRKCFLGEYCKIEEVKKLEDTPEKPLSKRTEGLLIALGKKYIRLNNQKKKLEDQLSEASDSVKSILGSHGQKEVFLGKLEFKFGVRYKMNKNKEDISLLIEAGEIGIEEKPETYLIISEASGEA